jgi:FKBP-type peptidyl-prolyl cis-trans isomerase
VLLKSVNFSPKRIKMKVLYINIRIWSVFILFILVTGCTPEEPGSRTRETEWEELDALIKELEGDGENVDTTDLSVFYIVRNTGEGPFPEVGDSCSVSYYGYYLIGDEGYLFENSREIYPVHGKWGFIYKPQHNVTGFIDGLGYMNEGSEIEMYIHSDFAYGKEGTNIIPPYTTLFYRATMHKVFPRE